MASRDTKSTFESLEVWIKGRELRNEISALAKRYPKEEKFRLADQMIRASRSVTANVAEGHGRYHFQENIQFCRLSRGSLYELVDHLSVALDEKYISEDIFSALKDKIFTIIKILNGYISYLKKQKSIE
jgi:four helix bundle protein